MEPVQIGRDDADQYRRRIMALLAAMEPVQIGRDDARRATPVSSSRQSRNGARPDRTG